jgi:hypothetical protein
VIDADMLEHADRDDAVERPFDIPIVPKEELDPIAEIVGGRAVVGDRALLL